MKKPVFTDPQDYLALAVRRKWWIIVPCLLLSLVSGVVVYRLPNIYLSETLILIEPRDVPDDFVRDLTTIDAEERLDVVQQTILSRTNLFQIITEFEAQLIDFRDLDEEQKISKLRERIDTEAQAERGKASFIRIWYEDQDPGLAQKITSRLASLLIEYDNRIREQQVFGTAEFIGDELRNVSVELQKLEQVIAQVKQQYRYELPEQLDTNLRTLDQLHTQSNTNAEALDRAVAIRLELERQISETEAVLVEQSVGSLRRAASPLVQEYSQKQRLHQELTSRYTERHPDVQRLKAELDRLESEIPEADLMEAEEPESSGENQVETPNPVYQKLTAQLTEVQREIEIRQRERVRIQSEIKKYNQRVENTPKREQEMASVLRAYAELQKQYEDLKGKEVESKLAESLESMQKGSQFVIMDPANYPIRPSKPNRMRLVFMGLFFSLSLGVGLAFGVDVLGQKFWLHSEVEALLGVRLLVEIPEIVTEGELRERKRRRLRYGLLFVVVLGVVVGGAYSILVIPELRIVAGGYFRQMMELVER